MWEKGSANGHTYQAKVYDQPSHFGIKNGRVSKLQMIDENTGEVVANYDRGWDLRPENAEAKEALRIILAKYR